MEGFIEELLYVLPDVREQISNSENDEEEVIKITSVEQLGPLIDHTNLKIDATRKDLMQLVNEAMDISAASVCVHSVNVKFVAEQSSGRIPVCSVVGFPTGAVPSVVKAAEASAAVADGATEIDMVIHIGAMKDKRYTDVYLDVKAVRDAVPGVTLKVILETSSLTKEEVLLASWASKLAGADFLKTSTGFGPGGATVEDVRILRSVSKRVKASGGMKTRQDCESMLAAGATRLGLSRGFGIIKSSVTESGTY
jgi:deoxyribose-phosphate aldolase